MTDGWLGYPELLRVCEKLDRIRTGVTDTEVRVLAFEREGDIMAPMKDDSGRILTNIKPWEIIEGDILLIGRDSRPAEIAVGMVEKLEGGTFEHAGAWYGREKHVTVTTLDGAVLKYDEGDDNEDEVNEFGTIQRVSATKADALLTDSLILDALVVDDDLSHRQRKVLRRVLESFRENVHGTNSETLVPTVAASALVAADAEVSRGIAAMVVVAARLASARDHPRFPRSKEYAMKRAIWLAAEASSGDMSWPSKGQSYEYRWSQGSQTLLAEDWAASREFDLRAGPQVPLAEFREAMSAIRGLRAIAARVALETQHPLSVASTPKILKDDFTSILVELDRISSGS